MYMQSWIRLLFMCVQVCVDFFRHVRFWTLKPFYNLPATFKNKWHNDPDCELTNSVLLVSRSDSKSPSYTPPSLCRISFLFCFH